MAIALLVTFSEPSFTDGGIALTSQSLTFVSEKAAEKALEALQESYKPSNIAVRGTILKDVVI